MKKRTEKDVQALCRLASEIIRHCRKNNIAIAINGVDQIPLLDEAVSDVEGWIEPWISDEEVAKAEV